MPNHHQQQQHSLFQINTVKYPYLYKVQLVIDKQNRGELTNGERLLQIESDLALLEACRNGDLEVIKYLVENFNANVDASDGLSRQACLHRAVLTGSFDVIQYLVEHGAALNVTNNQRTTPMDLAGEAATLETIQFLFENGAKCSDSGHILMYKTVFRGCMDIIDYLVHQRGINIDAKNHAGHTLLNRYSHERGLSHVVEMLLRMGANPNIGNKDGVTPLHQASAAGILDTVKLLCEYGADVNTQSNDGTSPLQSALLNHRPDVALYLLKERSANGNIRCGETSSTPLQYACKFGYFNVVEQLLKMGSEHINEGENTHKNDFGSSWAPGTTPLHYACHLKINYSKNEQALMEKLQIIKLLVAHGANITAKDEDGETPLHHAFKYRFGIAVTFLLETGGPEILCVGDWGERYISMLKIKWPIPITYWTTFLRACPVFVHIFPKEILKGLLSYDPGLFQRVTLSQTGNLPIHDAFMYVVPKDGVLEYMIEKYPAGLNHRNARGRLPFHEACGTHSGIKEEKLADIVTLLLQYNPSALVERDALGRLPIEIAIASNSPIDVLYILLRGFPQSLQELAR